jgi:hypothetical protein
MLGMADAGDNGDGSSGGDSPARDPAAPSASAPGSTSPASSDAPAPEPSLSPDDWRTGLGPEEVKRLAKFKSPLDAARSYLHLESKMGTAVQIPGPDAKPEDVKAFHVKLGVPERAEDYKLTTPPEEAGWSKTLEGTARSAFHEVGLTPAQAQRMIDVHVKMVEDEGIALVEEGKKSLQALRTEWGPDFQQKWNLGQQAIADFFGKEARDLLSRSPLGNSVSFFKSMANLGAELNNGKVERGDGAATYKDLKTELGTIRGDPKGPYWDRTHPMNGAYVNRAFEIEQQLAIQDERNERP